MEGSIASSRDHEQLRDRIDIRRPARPRRRRGRIPTGDPDALDGVPDEPLLKAADLPEPAVIAHAHDTISASDNSVASAALPYSLTIRVDRGLPWPTKYIGRGSAADCG